MEVTVTMETKTDIPVYRKSWKCQKTIPQKKDVMLNLPSRVAYKPSKNNPNYSPVDKGQLKLWVVTKDVYNQLKTRNKQYYDFSVAKSGYDLQFPNAYSRPEKPSTECLSWIETVLQSLEQFYSPYCPLEPGILL